MEQKRRTNNQSNFNLNENISTLSIVKIRESKKIPQKKLGFGICKGGTLCEIESGLTIPDFFLLEALVERCGETLDHYSIIISRKEYLCCDARREIEHKIFYGDLQEAISALEQYELKVTVKGSLHLQYFHCMKALLEMKKGNLEESLALFYRAIQDTQPSWKREQIEEFLLSSREIRIICCIFFLRIKIEPPKALDALFCEMTVFYGYLNENYENEKSKMKFYSAFTSVYADLCLLSGKQGAASQVLQEEQELSNRNGGYSWCKNYKGNHRQWMNYICYESGLNGLDRVFFQPQRGDTILIDEAVKEGKQVNENFKVQSELSGLDRTSISKIINGKRVPRENTYMQIAYFLNIRKRKISGMVFSQEPMVEELALKIQDAIWLNQCEGIGESIGLLREELDMEEGENQEYIDCIYYFYEYRKNKNTKEQLRDYFVSVVKIKQKKPEQKIIYSMGGKDFFQLTVLIYSYIVTGNKEEARMLLEMIELRLTNSIIKPLYRYHRMFLFYVLAILANRKEFNSVCYSYIKKGFNLMKVSECGTCLGYFLYFYWEMNSEKSPHSKRKCREILEYAYKFSCLNQQTGLTAIIEEQYQVHYQAYYDEGSLEANRLDEK